MSNRTFCMHGAHNPTFHACPCLIARFLTAPGLIVYGVIDSFFWMKIFICLGGFPYKAGIRGTIKTAQIPLSARVNLLNNPVERSFNMSLFAPWASAWGSESAAIFKHVPTSKAAKRENHEPFLPGTHRTCYVTEMFVHQLFTDTKDLGKLPPGHFLLTQELNHLTSYGQNGNVFFLVHFSGRAPFFREFISKGSTMLKS